MNVELIKIYKAAAAWSAKCARDDVSPDDLAALDVWLAADERNAEAYAQVCDALMRVDRFHSQLAKLYPDTRLSDRS